MLQKDSSNSVLWYFHSDGKPSHDKNKCHTTPDMVLQNEVLYNQKVDLHYAHYMYLQDEIEA